MCRGARADRYRSLFDRHGLRQDDIESVDDLAAIPLTSREDLLRLSGEEAVAREARASRRFVYRTSGSSGEPLSIRRSWLDDVSWQFFHLRAMHEFARCLMDRHGRLELLGHRAHAGDWAQRRISSVWLSIERRA
jgi:phenylacetate-coenzyme A ligase PaaK-like adenylate-forming protein